MPIVSINRTCKSCTDFNACAAVTAHERSLAAHTSYGTSLDKMGYAWDQSDEEVSIYFELIASAEDDVKCDFSPHACMLHVRIGEQRYFFEISRTYAQLDPSQCVARRGRKRITLRLRKQKPMVEWPSLRSMDGDFGVL